MQQTNEFQVPTTKEKTENKVKKVFSKIYNYVFKRLKDEDIVRQSLMVEKVQFIGYNKIPTEDGDAIVDYSVGLVSKPGADEKENFLALILNPEYKYIAYQDVLVVSWGNKANHYILGPAEKTPRRK